jgi:ABC-type uncharacterized transport system substrate-binding protein
VFGFSGDPLDVKLVQSWAKPGGNFTGMSYLAVELVGKRIELLKQWLPHSRRIAVLARPVALLVVGIGTKWAIKGFAPTEGTVPPE